MACCLPTSDQSKSFSGQSLQGKHLGKSTVNFGFGNFDEDEKMITSVIGVEKGMFSF